MIQQGAVKLRALLQPRELSASDLVNYLTVAEALSKRGLQHERQVEMAQKYLAQLEVESKIGESDFFTKQDAETHYYYRASRRNQGLDLEADGYLRLKQSEEAQITLAQMDESLQDLKTLAGDKQMRTVRPARNGMSSTNIAPPFWHR
jgi:hypothetical protein